MPTEIECTDTSRMKPLFKKETVAKRPAKGKEGKSFFENLAQDGLVDKRGLAQYLAISTRTVDRLLSEGLPRIVVRGSYRFDKKEAVEWLKKGAAI